MELSGNSGRKVLDKSIAAPVAPTLVSRTEPDQRRPCRHCGWPPATARAARTSVRGRPSPIAWQAGLDPALREASKQEGAPGSAIGPRSARICASARASPKPRLTPWPASGWTPCAASPTSARRWATVVGRRSIDSGKPAEGEIGCRAPSAWSPASAARAASASPACPAPSPSHRARTTQPKYGVRGAVARQGRCRRPETTGARSRDARAPAGEVRDHARLPVRPRLGDYPGGLADPRPKAVGADHRRAARVRGGLRASPSVSVPSSAVHSKPTNGTRR